jgi:hypothetical protein
MSKRKSYNHFLKLVLKGAFTFSIKTLSISKFSILTLSSMTFSIMTNSITTFSIMTLSITTFSIMTLRRAAKKGDTQHNGSVFMLRVT